MTSALTDLNEHDSTGRLEPLEADLPGVRGDLLEDGRPDLVLGAQLLEGFPLEAGEALLGERRQPVAVAHHQRHARELALLVSNKMN